MMQALDRDVAIVEFLLKHKNASTWQIGRKFGISTYAARQKLKLMEASGVVERSWLSTVNNIVWTCTDKVEPDYTLGGLFGSRAEI